MSSQRRSTKRHRSRGQGLVEFALVLPVVLLIMMLALDLGRVFYAWVALNNAARVGADFAATHPYAWDGIASPQDAIDKAEYVARIQRETGGLPCALPAPGPPTFPGNSLALGQPAKVGLRCTFPPLTPIVSSIVGNAFAVSASSVFPIRAGLQDVEVPLPPCFNQAIVPVVVGLKPDDAQVQIESVGLVPAGTPNASLKGKPNDVKTQDPAGGLCVDLGATVSYVYKP